MVGYGLGEHLVSARGEKKGVIGASEFRSSMKWVMALGMGEEIKESAGMTE